MNPRVQWTVDFESTAIPGYAISAAKTPTCESDIRLTRPQATMIIQVEHLGETSQVESSGPISVSEVLEKLGVAPSTVLAIHEETIVPHTSIIKNDTKLEIVVVSSGG